MSVTLMSDPGRDGYRAVAGWSILPGAANVRTVLEPLALGFSSGLSCLTSCGVLLAPWLASSGDGASRTAGVLAVFLGGRLAGYLAFATLVWGAARVFPAGGIAHGWADGLVDAALALLLGGWAFLGLRRRGERCRSVRWGPLERRAGWSGAALLGVLSGVNLCPPFLAAGVRASGSGSLGGTLAFFALFFLGTTVWFAPFLASAWLRRWAAVALVARMTLALLAAYYAYASAVLLLARWQRG